MGLLRWMRQQQSLDEPKRREVKLDSIEEAPVYIDGNGGLYVDPDELVASKRFGEVLKEAAELDLPGQGQEDEVGGA